MLSFSTILGYFFGLPILWELTNLDALLEKFPIFYNAMEIMFLPATWLYDRFPPYRSSLNSIGELLGI